MKSVGSCNYLELNTNKAKEMILEEIADHDLVFIENCIIILIQILGFGLPNNLCWSDHVLRDSTFSAVTVLGLN